MATWRRLSGTAEEIQREDGVGVRDGSPGAGEAVAVGGGVYPSGWKGVKLGVEISGVV